MAVTPADMLAAGVTGMGTDEPRLTRIYDYMRGAHADPYMPSSATAEYKLLATRAVSNWIPLIVKTPAQAMSVSGYRKAGVASGQTAPEWLAWQANRMDSRQHAVIRGALAYGLSYVTVLPDQVSGEPKMRGVSARRMYASYADPASDALPLWALELDHIPDANSATDVATGTLIDQTTVYDVTVTGGGDKATMSATVRQAHGVTLDGLPVCPVVRFAPDVDLDGEVSGVVEPLIPTQDRVNQTTFDLLIAQTFGSFKVRTASGMALDFQRDSETGELVLDSNGRPTPLPIPMNASRMIVSPDPDTKFSSLAETPLDGFLAAIETGVKELAAVSQTPPHYMLGSIVNLSAEALAAAEAALSRAVREYQDGMGESFELVMSLTTAIQGGAPDPAAQITWNDFESRSLAQTVDALGKAVTMLGVPARAMWQRIPGVTSTDVEAWSQIAEADDPAARVANALADATAPQVVADDQS